MSDIRELRMAALALMDTSRGGVTLSDILDMASEELIEWFDASIRYREEISKSVARGK